MYILEEENRCIIHTTDGEAFDVDETISEMRKIVEPFEEFERVNKKSIVNFKYISAVMPASIVMQDYAQIKISPLRYRSFKYLKEETDELD